MSLDLHMLCCVHETSQALGYTVYLTVAAFAEAVVEVQPVEIEKVGIYIDATYLLSKL